MNAVELPGSISQGVNNFQKYFTTVLTSEFQSVFIAKVSRGHVDHWLFFFCPGSVFTRFKAYCFQLVQWDALLV